MHESEKRALLMQDQWQVHKDGILFLLVLSQGWGGMPNEVLLK